MTTPTDWRALCAELLAGADEYTGMNPYMRLDNAMKAARAALAQPEPQGPTDEDVEAAARVIYGSMRFDRIGYTKPWVDRGNSFAQDEARRCARAVFARWGRPAIEPVPVSERPWERNGWCDENGWCWGFDADDSDPYWIFDDPASCPCWTHLLPHYALPVPEA